MSIQDSKARPLAREPPHITTRPVLPPDLAFACLSASLNLLFTYF